MLKGHTFSLRATLITSAFLYVLSSSSFLPSLFLSFWAAAPGDFEAASQASEAASQASEAASQSSEAASQAFEAASQASEAWLSSSFPVSLI